MGVECLSHFVRGVDRDGMQKVHPFDGAASVDRE
jgi:hypothetical protein